MMIDRTQQPVISDFSTVEMTFAEERILANGVKLLIINSGDQEVCRFDIIFNGGLYEQHQPMVCNALASMLRHGGKGYDSAAIAEIFDFYGAWTSGRAHHHHTSFTVYSLNRCFKDLMPVIESIIKKPTLPAHEFELIKKQSISSLNNSKEQVRYLATQKFNEMYFGKNHPFGKNISVKDIEALNLEMLETFHQAHFSSQNCTIMLTGKVTNEMIACVDAYFGNTWGNKKEFECSNAIPITHSTTKLEIVDKPGSLQSAVIMGLDAIPRNHADYIPLRILVKTFGGYFGSRLMTNIRETKGYTYGISAGLIGRHEHSYIMITSECDTKYTHLLINEVKNEMRKLAEEPIDNDELNRVKSNIISDMVGAVDSPFAIADYNLTAIYCNISKDYFAKQVEIIKKITAKELQEIAQKYFVTDNLFMAIAGDKKKIEKMS
ncbi:MAG: pitrilysin family protein [Muribaculaceae bacterium]